MHELNELLDRACLTISSMQFLNPEHDSHLKWFEWQDSYGSNDYVLKMVQIHTQNGRIIHNPSSPVLAPIFYNSHITHLPKFTFVHTHQRQFTHTYDHLLQFSKFTLHWYIQSLMWLQAITDAKHYQIKQ